MRLAALHAGLQMSMPSGSNSLPDPHSERISVERIAALYRNGAVGPVGALVAALILAGVLISLGDLGWLHAAGWISWGAACVVIHMVLRHFYWRSPRRDEAWRRGAPRSRSCRSWTGSGGPTARPGLWRRVHLDGQLLANMVGATVAVGAALAYGNHPPAFLGVFAPITTLTFVWNISWGDRLHVAIAGLIVVFVVTMNVFAHRAYLSFVDTLRTRFEKDALAEDLRRQKELAEEANLSKSRFLAAASHDLRQPIHALGMFVGALAGYPMSEEMRRLVGQIEGSVGAMDGLFNSLLDISKLDAGVVHLIRSRSRSARCSSECAMISSATRAEGAVAHLLPMHGFRRLRSGAVRARLAQLVANAVRYTDRGRIPDWLPARRAARRRDLGHGPRHARRGRERVFQEFYQVDNFERDRSKGLGLGLAIVKRLTELLGHPHGNAHVARQRLRVQNICADRSRHRRGGSPACGADVRELRGALILVVDDESWSRKRCAAC